MKIKVALIAAALAAFSSIGVANAGAAEFTGVSSRLSSPDSRYEHSRHPQLHLVSVMLNWNSVEPSKGIFNWSALQPSIVDARLHGYKLIVRIMCGAKAPTWLYTDATNPVTKLDLIATDGGAKEIIAPLPWDPDLLVNYRGMVSSLQTWLQGTDGAGSTRASHVYFVPVAMPTELGTEMPVSYGGGSYTGIYKGRSGTWNVAAANRAEWLSHAVSGTTDLTRERSNRASMESAWVNAIEAHMVLLPSVRSAIAMGGVFGDGYGAAKRIASLEVGKYPTRLYAMTTNLRAKVYANGTLGPYRAWDPNAHQAMMNAIAAGGQVGFQTARSEILDTSAKFHTAVEDAISTYGVRFIETAPYQLYLEQQYLLLDSQNVQSRLSAASGL
jgi:hypothetical protein